MDNLSEQETREIFIDPLLKEVGWTEEAIKREVNSVKSDFKNNYVLRGETIERGVDRFIDYVLIDDDGTPLTIIEAKRTSFDADKGSIQAVVYQQDIEAKTGKKVPIFLTNGGKWFIKEQGYPSREISGPFSKEDLLRRRSLFEKRKDLTEIEVDQKILTRARGVQAVKQVLDYFAKGNRQALVTMATGTGKTRVAMALIRALVDANYIRNVLFVVDRISLGRQAKNKGLGKYFQEPICLLNEEQFSNTDRFYVSTVQTLMSPQKEGGNYFQKFSPGFFDLIIFDEVHRSYYSKQKLVMQYFDALKVGLTATPSGDVSKNTYDLFGCAKDKPTVKYTYEEAVDDGILVPYRAQIIETNVLALGIRGSKLTKELKDALKKQEEDPEFLELPGTLFEKYFRDRKTNELIITEFMNRCYKSDEGKPCKTIFFCASVPHAKEMKRIFDELYPNLESEVEVIVSEKDKYMEAVRKFELESSPRIALSVGVLDTGIDVPEICNLVFVKPVLSPIRFWQMLGRGTRNLDACEHKEWLPSQEGIHYKNDFLILDFMFGNYSNVKVHKLILQRDTKQSEDIREKIFKKELELLKKKLSDDEKQIVETHILDAVNNIDQKSFIVRDKLPIIRKVVSKKFDLKEHIEQLKREVSPLLKFSEFGDGKVYSFISKCVDLFEAVKQNNAERKEEIEEFVKERVENVWRKGLNVILAKENELRKVMSDNFWEELGFDDIDFLIREIAPLIAYYEKDRKNMLVIDADDFVINVEEEIKKVDKNPDFEKFKEGSLIKKFKEHGLTWKELLELEKQLSELNPSFTIEKIQKARKIDFVLFLREMIGLSTLPDPQIMIENEFNQFIVSRNKSFNVAQIEFLRYLSKFFAQSKHLELKDFAEHPLAEENPMELFSTNQLKEIVRQAETIKFK